jgi:hypothetical protein
MFQCSRRLVSLGFDVVKLNRGNIDGPSWTPSKERWQAKPKRTKRRKHSDDLELWSQGNRCRDIPRSDVSLMMKERLEESNNNNTSKRRGVVASSCMGCMEGSQRGGHS